MTLFLQYNVNNHIWDSPCHLWWLSVLSVSESVYWARIYWIQNPLMCNPGYAPEWFCINFWWNLPHPYDKKLLIPRVHNNDILIIPCVCGKSLKVPVMFKGWRSKKNPKFHLNRAINGVLPSWCYHKWLETKEIFPKNVVNQYCDKKNVLAKVVTFCHIICR